jgi:hypothetical protein
VITFISIFAVASKERFIGGYLYFAGSPVGAKGNMRNRLVIGAVRRSLVLTGNSIEDAIDGSFIAIAVVGTLVIRM